MALVRRRATRSVTAAQRRSFLRGKALEWFLADMPDRYFLSTPEDAIPHHFALVRRLEEQPVVTEVVHFPEREFSAFTVVTRDQPGLFAKLTGVLRANGMNIVGARINTSRDGIALDSFRVGHLDHRERVLEPERWDRVQQALGRVLRGEVDVETLVAASRRPSILERPARPASARFTNAQSRAMS